MKTPSKRERRAAVEAKHSVPFDADEPWSYFTAEMLESAEAARKEATRPFRSMFTPEQREAARRMEPPHFHQGATEIERNER